MEAPQVYRVELNRDCALKEPTVLGNEEEDSPWVTNFQSRKFKVRMKKEWVEAVVP